jgi:hypothetical protein
VIADGVRFRAASALDLSTGSFAGATSADVV